MNHQEIYNKSKKDIRLDVFLLDHLVNTSRTKIQKLMKDLDLVKQLKKQYSRKINSIFYMKMNKIIIL